MGYHRPVASFNIGKKGEHSPSASSSPSTAPACAEPRLAPLRVGGLTPLIEPTDYPGELAAVVFCQGCPWRCGYCHNPHLLPRARRRRDRAGSEVLAFLRTPPRAARRRGVHRRRADRCRRGWRAAMREVRALGFAIGLHTAGIYPRRLAEVLPLVDWVGFDVKAPFDAAYERITGVRGSGAAALRERAGICSRAAWTASSAPPGMPASLARPNSSASRKRSPIWGCAATRCRNSARAAASRFRSEGAPVAADLDALARRFAQFSLRRA